jgi:hypothetical protein
MAPVEFGFLAGNVERNVIKATFADLPLRTGPLVGSQSGTIPVRREDLYVWRDWLALRKEIFEDDRGQGGWWATKLVKKNERRRRTGREGEL